MIWLMLQQHLKVGVAAANYHMFTLLRAARLNLANQMHVKF